MINKRRYQICHKNIWYVMMKIQRRRMIIIYSNNTDESTCMIEISYKYIPQMQDTFIKHTWILSKRLFYSFFYGDYFNLSFWFRVLYAQCNIIKNLFKLHTRTLTFSETIGIGKANPLLQLLGPQVCAVLRIQIYPHPN